METFVGYWRIPYSNFQYEKSKTVIFDWIQRRNEFLMQELANSSVTYEIKNISTNTTLLEVIVEGNSSVFFNANGLGKNVFTRNANSEKEIILVKKYLTPRIGRETSNLGSWKTGL